MAGRHFSLFSKILVFAFGLILVVAAVSLTQTGSKLRFWSGKDSTHKKVSRVSPRFIRDTSDTLTGRLIVEGVFVPGPYEVVVRGSTITINGDTVFAPPERKEPPPNAAADSSSNRVEQFHSEFSANYHRWIEELGMAEARQRALQYVQSHPWVDTAYMLGDIEIRYRLHNWKMEGGISFSRMRDTTQTREERLASNLEFLGRQIQGALDHGSLVIIMNKTGRYITFSRREALPKFLKLEEIAATIPDVEERFAAIKEIVHNKTAARQIAEKFMQK